MGFSVVPLGPDTWDGFADLVDRNNGIFGGCWCVRFGDVDELPGIKHRRAYEQAPPPVPDWRITCVFADKRHRGQGVARQAVEGAIDLIERAGGGLVEAIPEATEGRDAPGRFLFSASAELFDDLGFERVRQVGKHAWIVRRRLDARA